MKKPFLAILFLLLLNAVVALFFHIFIFNYLDGSQFKEKNRLLDLQLNIVKTEFKNVTPEQWKDAAYDLQSKTNTGVNIWAIKSNNVLDYVRKQIEEPLNKDGFIDAYGDYVYLPLDEEYVLEVGPVYYNVWYTYLPEWALLISSVFCSGILLFFFLTYYDKEIANLRQHIRSFVVNKPRKSDDPVREIYQCLSQLVIENQQQREALNQQVENHKDLLHGVAHEFRSPMARIQFAIEMLQEGQSNNELLSRQIEQNVTELDALVSEILSYARLQHSDKQLDIQPVDAKEIIDDAVAKVRDVYTNVNFECEVPEDSQLPVDYHMFNRALVNLLRNAGRYAKSICRTEVSIGDNNIEVCIHDNGPGIPPGKRKRIFEPFTRLDPSRSRDSGGAGLGLSIVHGIVSKHHGTIEAKDSSLGGAKFVISIPYKMAS